MNIKSIIICGLALLFLRELTVSEGFTQDPGFHMARESLFRSQTSEDIVERTAVMNKWCEDKVTTEQEYLSPGLQQSCNGVVLDYSRDVSDYVRYNRIQFG